MEQLYSLRKICLLLVISFAAYSSTAQSVCGPIIQNFDNTGGTMGGFTSSSVNSTATGFTYTQSGPNGYLQRCAIPTGGSVYELVTPTYTTLASQTAVGYGFELSGAVKVSRVVVLLQYVANDGSIISVEVNNFAPNYSGPGANDVAIVCTSFGMSTYTGFDPGDSYRLVFQFTSSSASNQGQCITFDNFRTTGGAATAPLPVTFTGFGAKKAGTGIELIWNVAGERDVRSYIVERSTTGTNFSKVGEVAATNSSAYSFIDNQAVNGLVFYRIKEVDLDGSYKYSTIVRLNLNINATLRAYPLPARNVVTIEHSVTNKGALAITTADGRLVKQIVVRPELNQTVINISDLKPGLYMIRFTNAGITEHIKLIKE